MAAASVAEFSVLVDRPFSGALVPAKYYRREPRVQAARTLQSAAPARRAGAKSGENGAKCLNCLGAPGATGPFFGLEISKTAYARLELKWTHRETNGLVWPLETIRRLPLTRRIRIRTAGPREAALVTRARRRIGHTGRSAQQKNCQGLDARESARIRWVTDARAVYAGYSTRSAKIALFCRGFLKSSAGWRRGRDSHRHFAGPPTNWKTLTNFRKTAKHR
jgi:hypothetical protein